MQEEIYDEIEHLSFSEKYLGLTWLQFLLSIVAVVLLGIYMWVVLFGENSLEVLLSLEEYESYLHKEVEALKEQNAQLQKEYFELKELEREQ